jgi:hypothetical protein
MIKNDKVRKAVATQIVNSFLGVSDSGTSTSLDVPMNSNMLSVAFMLRFAKVTIYFVYFLFEEVT